MTDAVKQARKIAQRMAMARELAELSIAETTEGSPISPARLVAIECVLSSCFRPFRLEFLGQFGTVLGRLSVAGVLRVIS